MAGTSSYGESSRASVRRAALDSLSAHPDKEKAALGGFRYGGEVFP
jgi:hypothetical protein